MATTQSITTGVGARAGISTSPSGSLSLVPGHVRQPDPRVVGSIVAALVFVSAAIVTGCLLGRAWARKFSHWTMTDVR